MNRLPGPAALVLGLLFAATTQASSGFEVHGAFGRFSMHDMNDSLSSLNRNIGASFEPIHGGPSYGVALRQWASPNVLLRYGLERLEASSDDAGVRFSATALAYSIGGTYFPPATGRMRVGYGINFGPYRAFGKISSPQARLQTRGNGYGLCLAGEGMVPLKNGWSSSVILGYRFAAIWHVRLADVPSDLAIQYSGPFARISVAIDSRP